MPTPEHIGRIRVNENEARLLLFLLFDYRQQMLDERRQIMEQDGDHRFQNRELLHIRKVWQELSMLAEQKRWSVDKPEQFDEETTLLHIHNLWQELSMLAEQKGWSIGEPEQFDEETADPGLPQREDWPVGEWDRTGDGSRRRLRGVTTSP